MTILIGVAVLGWFHFRVYDLWTHNSCSVTESKKQSSYWHCRLYEIVDKIVFYVLHKDFKRNIENCAATYRTLRYKKRLLKNHIKLFLLPSDEAEEYLECKVYDLHSADDGEPSEQSHGASNSREHFNWFSRGVLAD